MTDPKVTAEDPLYKCSQLCDGHVLRYCAKHVDEALTLARANADELFVLSVDCELGSGCRKDRTCSGASHWQTAEQLRASGAAAMRERAANWIDENEWKAEDLSDKIRDLLPPSAEKDTKLLNFNGS